MQHPMHPDSSHSRPEAAPRYHDQPGYCTTVFSAEGCVRRAALDEARRALHQLVEVIALKNRRNEAGACVAGGSPFSEPPVIRQVPPMEIYLLKRWRGWP